MTLNMKHMKLKWIWWNLSEIIASFCTRDYSCCLIFVVITFQIVVSWHSSKLPIEKTNVHDFIRLIIAIYQSQANIEDLLGSVSCNEQENLCESFFFAVFHPKCFSMKPENGVHYPREIFSSACSIKDPLCPDIKCKRKNLPWRGSKPSLCQIKPGFQALWIIWQPTLLQSTISPRYWSINQKQSLMLYRWITLIARASLLPWNHVTFPWKICRFGLCGWGEESDNNFLKILYKILCPWVLLVPQIPFPKGT